MTPHTNRARRTLPAVLVAGAVLASLAACSGDDDGGAASGDFSVADALADLPRSALEDQYVFTAGDLDRATELAGATRPAADSDDGEAVADWALGIEGVRRGDGEAWPAVAGLMPEAANPNTVVQVADFREEFGWTILDVRSFAEVSAPPARFTVFDGEFDTGEIDAAIGGNDDGLWSVGGEDFEVDVSQSSPARPLGESLRLAEQDGNLAVSKSTPPIEDWLEDGDRLDDDDNLAPVAEALDEHDVYAAMIVDGDALGFVSPGGSEATPEQIEALAGQQLVPFDVLGAGLTVVDGKAVGVLAYEHATADAAEENADVLETLFAEGLSVRTYEPLSETFTDVKVTVDGTTVMVTLGFDAETPPKSLWNAIQIRELFASHA